MLKYLFFIISLISVLSANSQTTIIKLQNFDETSPVWNFTTDVPFFDNGSDGFFGVHDGDNDGDPNDTGIAINAGSLEFINIENDFLFINDLNDEGDNGTNSEAIISFEDVDLQIYRNVYITFDYELVGFGTADYIRYEIIEDGISTLIEELPKSETGTSTITIKNSTKILSFRFIIKQNGQVDFAAIDNVTIRGQLTDPCNELLISEYIEGSSSTSHRNNFIELYNPTGTPVDLGTYDLIKYTGKNTVISNVLDLDGTISAYGTFLIEDSKENLGVTADLSTNNAVMDFTGDDKIALRSTDTIIDLIGIIGDSINFAKDVTLRRKSNVQNPNNQFNLMEWDIYDLEELGNINSHVSNCGGAIPEIEVSGNSQLITDGSESTSSTNNTYFGTVALNSGDEIIKIFYLKNIGNDMLIINNLSIAGSDRSDFSILSEPVTNIQPLDSIKIILRFKPANDGIKTAIINIENNDASENPFDFTIQGEGTGATDGPLMISQYYEGSGNNKWIEITNISKTTTSENTYFIALFWNDDAKNPIGIKPSRTKAIPGMVPGEIVKYRSTLNVIEPDYALDGKEIKSGICSFTGDDILIITTSNDKTSWANRIDVIGTDTFWGKDISYVRKYGCKGVDTNTGFNPLDWFIYEITDINNALADSNQRIGKHHTGSTSFTNNNKWNNGIPDKYRTAIIEHNFDSFVSGSLETCNLIINTGKIVTINGGNYIAISNDLNVNGILEIQHEASLYMINNDGSVINNGEINVYKTTTTIKRNDYTYWSSPIKNAELATVFEASPQNSFYTFETQNYSDLNNDNSDDDGNAWRPANGFMALGKGYTAMAPDTNPFVDKQTVIFKGPVNNGIIRMPVALSDDSNNSNDDWNLIGNPYPSAISADLFLNDVDNIPLLNGSIYYWTHNTSADADNDNKYSANDYAIYNIGTGGIKASSQGETPTGIIASGQGVFVEAIQSGNIIFNNEMRVKLENDNFFKREETKNPSTSEQDKIWLNMSNDQGAFSQTLIGFMDGASKTIESAYDALRLDGSNYLSFYSIVENEHLAIQGTNPISDEEVIPLGYSSVIQEKVALKISIARLEGKLVDRDIYLEDNLLQNIHNLKKSDYSFTLDNEGIFNNRFQLKFVNAALNDEEIDLKEEELIISKDNEFLHIKTNQKSTLSSVRIYDILGRTILEANPNEKEYLLNYGKIKSSGIFIIRVKLKNSKILTKKVII